MSDEIVPFFVPNADGEDEKVYGTVAKLIGAVPQPRGQRISLIEFEQDGGVWIARVGHRLHGTETRIRQRNKVKQPVTTRLPDGPLIVAIYPGNPYMIFTGGGGGWNQPIYVGRPTKVERFAA